MNKNVKSLAIGFVCTAVLSSTAYADSMYTLISDAEYLRSVELNDVDDALDDDLFNKGADLLAPDILVRQPGEGDEFDAPIDIDIAFIPTDGSEIDVGSLKITYGALGINVTDRVTENAEVTQAGIISNGAMLPAGKHKLTVYITDDKGREGKRRFKFEIREK